MSAFNPLDHPICFAYPLRLASSGWTGHVPFAMYLIDILRPKLVVELGTHNGVSYCSFCQAVKALKVETRCYAIDTWEGDEQAGFYGPEVLADLKEHHDPLYGGFSRLIQSTFDQAVAHFENKSIDLLHIDGCHTYEAVKHDFETWLPKLSEGGVILFHDINVREGKFGVWKFWKTLKRQYPHFEFFHSHGLGLAAVGKKATELLRELLDTSIEDHAPIREMFHQLGMRLDVTHELQTLKRAHPEPSRDSVAQQEIRQEEVRRAEAEVVSQSTAYEAQLARQMEDLSEVRSAYDTKIQRQTDELSEAQSLWNDQFDQQANEISNLHSVYEAQLAQLTDDKNKAQAVYESQNKRQALEFSLARLTYEAELVRQREELNQARAEYELQRNRLNHELNEARVGYEAQIQQQTDEFSQARSTFEALLTRQVNDLSDLHSALSASQHDSRIAADLNESLRSQYEALRADDESLRAQYESLRTLDDSLRAQYESLRTRHESLRTQYGSLRAHFESLRAQLVESESVIRARGEAIAVFQNESTKSREKYNLLSAQLSSKTRDLDQITGSRGWQLLSRYGRLKYRYLLPVYRMLSLAPDSRNVRGDDLASLSPSELQPMIQPQILQGWHAVQESLGQANGSEEAPVALESNSFDVVFDSLNELAEQPIEVFDQPTEVFDQLKEVSDQPRDLQPPPTQHADDQSGLRERLLVLQTQLDLLQAQLYQREEKLEQVQVQILAAEAEIRYRTLLSETAETRYRTLLSETKEQMTSTAEVPSATAQLSQQIKEAIAEAQKRMDLDPSILDWNSGLDLAASFPQLAVFSPLLSEDIDPILPYLDHSIDIVVTSSFDPGRIAEARRVAGIAVILNNTLTNQLEHLRPGKVAVPQVSLGIEWLTDQVNAPSMPTTSIIIPVFNKVSYTQSCLEQLSATLPQDFNGEIIVVDDASSDETAVLLEHWVEQDGRIKILRNAENLGFITSCNRGAESAKGDFLIFLNNDTLPLSCWLPPLLRILRDNPEAGAVGGKLVYPDGTLQEAGGVIFSDGSGCNFGKFDKAVNAPLYNFVREVDYCSGALLATRRDLFMELGGFDERFKPAYYEDVDYCFTLREKGYRVYYQPESVIVHFEGASSGTDLSTGVKGYQVVNRLKFLEKWSEALKEHYPAPDQYDPATLHSLSRRKGSTNGDGN